MKKITFIMLCVLFLAGCSGVENTTTCSKENVDAATQQFTVIIQKWSDMMGMANQTPRAYVINPIIEMQHIKWDVDELEIPKCLIDAKSYLVDSMTAGIDGMTMFMGQSPDKDVSAKIEEATNLMSKYTSELKRVNNCAPDCEK